VLFGSTRRRVLSLLYGRSEQRFYLRQIARETGAAIGAVQRELEALLRGGIIERTTEGRQVYFAANAACPIYSELRSIVLKTAGVVDVIRECLRPLAGRIRAAFVFGSAARGTLRGGSDIDLMVVGDVSFSDVAAAIAPAQERIGRDVSPTLYTPAEFRAKAQSGHHFLSTVLKQPRLFALGGSDELERLAEERMAARTPDERGGDPGPVGGRRPRPRRLTS
jgi:predicted nucleotidyltransferase